MDRTPTSLRGLPSWGLRISILMIAGALFAACSSPTRVATVTGDTVPEEPGRVLYAAACASCHGDSGQGAAGPALAGHTSEQIIRQVRAPVGEMPMFAPGTVSSFGLDGLLEMIEGLEVDHDAATGGHAHDANVLSKQEVSHIQHALILDAVMGRDENAAAHATEELLPMLSGNHQVAMTELLGNLQSGHLSEAQETLLDMAADAPFAKTPHYSDLLWTLALNALNEVDLEGATHWVGHLHDDGSAQAALVSTALAARDFDTAIALVQHELPEDTHADDEATDDHVDEADAHADDEDAHTDDEDAHTDDEAAHMDPDMVMEDEVTDAHTDEADAHTDEADAHTDEAEDVHEVLEPPSHDDDGAAPHDH